MTEIAPTIIAIAQASFNECTASKWLVATAYWREPCEVETFGVPLWQRRQQRVSDVHHGVGPTRA